MCINNRNDSGRLLEHLLCTIEFKVSYIIQDEKQNKCSSLTDAYTFMYIYIYMQTREGGIIIPWQLGSELV